MEDTRAESLPIGAAEAAAALQTLQRYKAGKAALDKRLIDNELWFRMGHWKNCENKMMEGKPSLATLKTRIEDYKPAETSACLLYTSPSPRDRG